VHAVTRARFVCVLWEDVRSLECNPTKAWWVSEHWTLKASYLHMSAGTRVFTVGQLQ